MKGRSGSSLPRVVARPERAGHDLIWNFREALSTGEDQRRNRRSRFCSNACDAALTKAGFLAMGRSGVGGRHGARRPSSATARPKEGHQRGAFPRWTRKPANPKVAMRAGRSIFKSRRPDGAKRVDLAIPAFGYKNLSASTAPHGLIRTWTATDASRHDGAQSETSSTRANTAGDVLGETRLSIREEQKSTWPTTAFAAKSSARSLRANRCQKPWRGPTARNRKFAPMSNTSSPDKRARWIWSFEQSVSPEPR